MGVKKLSRSRLYEAEKEGQSVLSSIDVGEAMKNAVVSATQHREGYKLTTDIVLDLGTSKADVLAGKTPAAPIGVATGTARICKLTQSVFGYVTEIRTVCIESVTTSGTDITNTLDLVSGSTGDGVYGTADGSAAGVLGGTANIGSVGSDKACITPGLDSNGFANKYLYLGNGQAAGTKSAGNAAMLIADATDAAHFNDGSRLVLYNEAGTKFEMIIDKTNLAWDATGVPYKIGLKNANTLAKIESGFEAGIEATNSHFAVTHIPNDGNVTIAAKSGTGAEGNSASHGNDNSYVPNGSETATVTIGNFTGGTTQGMDADNTGASFTGGKLLIRVVGFLAPADI